jgi:hypothetical protein
LFWFWPHSSNWSDANQLRLTERLQKMPQEPQVVDYEPVSRSGAAKGVGEANMDHRPNARHFNSDSGPGKVDHIDTAAKRPGPRPGTKEERNTSMMLRRGHAFGFAGLVLFTLILDFRPYELFPWLAWASSSAFVVALCTLIVYVPTQLGLEGNLTFRPREINLILLLFLAGLLSVPLALKRIVAWDTLQIFLKVIVMFIVMVNVVRTEKRLKVMLMLALVTSCILSAAAVNDYRMGVFLRDLDRNRIRGLFGNLFDNPNDLALHLVTMIPLALGMLLGSRGSLKKLFFAFCAVLSIAGVVATFSRGGFVGMVFAVGMLVWRTAKSNKLMIATCLPVALLVFVLLAPGGYGNRMATTGDDSGLARYDELKRSLFLAAHHPLFGVGMNNYIYYSNYDHATHNAYTQVASELGFPALVVYIWFLITPLKHLRRVARETSAARRKSPIFFLAAGLEASIVGYMAASFFLSVAYLWYVYYLVGYAICFRRLYDISQGNGAKDIARASPSKLFDRALNPNTVPVLESASALSVRK